MAIFLHQGEAESQFQTILKSQNLAKFPRFQSKFVIVNSKFIPQQGIFSGMAIIVARQ